MFPDPVDVLPISYPVSEDILLLGMVPLARFHSTIDFFKENNYEGTDEFNVDARRQIRWGRIREFVKGMAESSVCFLHIRISAMHCRTKRALAHSPLISFNITS